MDKRLSLFLGAGAELMWFGIPYIFPNAPQWIGVLCFWGGAGLIFAAVVLFLKDKLPEKYQKLKGLISIKYKWSIGFLFVILIVSGVFFFRTPFSLQENKFTLPYAFKHDFDNLLRMDIKQNVSNKDLSLDLGSKLYLDFESRVKFLGYYIPSTPHTFSLCVAIAENYKISLEKITKGSVVEAKSSRLPNSANISELIFSGRIYIYHEFSLLEKQKRELLDLYEKKDLSVQFIGRPEIRRRKELEILKNVQR